MIIKFPEKRQSKREKYLTNMSGVWKDWFAWYPVYVGEDTTGKRIWVWLQLIERKFEYSAHGFKNYYLNEYRWEDEHISWEYRIKKRKNNDKEFA